MSRAQQICLISLLYLYAAMLVSAELAVDKIQTAPVVAATLHEVEDDDSKPNTEQDKSPAEPAGLQLDSILDIPLSLLDEPQRYLSSGVNRFAMSIDEFFSDEKVLYDTNASYVRLTGDMVLNEGGDMGYAGNTNIKVSLPNTQKKLKLVFENDPKDSREGIDRKLDATPVDAAQEQNYFAGIEGVWGEFKNWKFRPGFGLKLSTRLDYFFRIRANRLYQMSEKWRAYLSDTLYWYDSTGYKFDFSLEFDRSIQDDFLFRSSSFASWKEENSYWDLSQVFSLTHTIDDKRALIYQAGVYGLSEPYIFAKDYFLQIRYRKRVHSNYLFLELIPKVLYRDDFNFKAENSLTIRLEIVFKA